MTKLGPLAPFAERMPGTIGQDPGEALIVGAVTTLPPAEERRRGEERRVEGSGTTPDKRYICEWNGTAYEWNGITRTYLPLTGGTLTGPLAISGTYPYLLLSDTDAPADEKNWQLVTNGGVLSILAAEDDWGSTQPILNVDRAGVVPGPASLYGNLIIAKANANLLIDASSGYARVQIDGVAGGQSVLNLEENGAVKWQIGRQTDNSVFLYDAVTPGNVWGAPSGGTIFNLYRDLLVSKTAPKLILFSTDASNAEIKLYDATDGGWSTFIQNGTLFFGKLNTAGVWTANYGAFSAGGALYLYGNAVSIQGTAPVLQLYETDAPTDEKQWEWLSVAGNLRLRTMNDAYDTAFTALEFIRVGNTVTQLNLGFNLIDFPDSTGKKLALYATDNYAIGVESNETRYATAASGRHSFRTGGYDAGAEAAFINAARGVVGGGLDYIDTWTWAGAASIARDSLFSTIYDDYVLVLRASNTANTPIYMKLRSGGADVSTNYMQNAFLHGYTTITNVQSGSAGPNARWLLTSAAGGGLDELFGEILLSAPYAAARTGHTLHLGGRFATATAANSSVGWTSQGNQNSTTQFTGIKLEVDSGTTSGQAWLYGRRK